MSALTPTELRTLADLAEKFAGLAIDLAKAREQMHSLASRQGSALHFAQLLTEAVDDDITGEAWLVLCEDTLAIVKEKSR